MLTNQTLGEMKNITYTHTRTIIFLTKSNNKCMTIGRSHLAINSFFTACYKEKNPMG